MLREIPPFLLKKEWTDDLTGLLSIFHVGLNFLDSIGCTRNNPLRIGSILLKSGPESQKETTGSMEPRFLQIVKNLHPLVGAPHKMA